MDKVLNSPLLTAGIVAATCQAIALIVIFVMLLLFHPYQQLSSSPAHAEKWESITYTKLRPTTVLALAEVLVAFGIVATINASTSVTARAIRKLATANSSNQPKNATKRLFWLTGVGSILLLAGALLGPPTSWLTQTGAETFVIPLELLWSAILSVAFAFVAATHRSTILSSRVIDF